jgi:predicted dehydrogenase
VTGVVVVGTGFGCITHVRALRAAGLDVVALVGRDPDKTAARATAFGVPHWFTSLGDALKVPGVDAVTIATPPHTHAPLALEAIAAGRHVLCEKPFTRDTAEAVEVHDAAERAGIVHLLGTEFRFDAGQATLARVVASGAIGQPRLATIVLHVPVLAERGATVPAWWADAASGGGWLGAHGSQVIDQVRAALGDFESVSASLPHMRETPMDAEDSFVVHFRLRSGVAGVLQSTAADWGPPLIETRIAGSLGTAWITGLGDRVHVADRHGSRRVAVDPDLSAPVIEPEPLPPDLLATTYEQMTAHGLDLPPYTRLATVFRDRIAGRPVPDEPRAATFADGVAAMAVLDAIRASAREDGCVMVTQ